MVGVFDDNKPAGFADGGCTHPGPQMPQSKCDKTNRIVSLNKGYAARDASEERSSSRSTRADQNPVPSTGTFEQAEELHAHAVPAACAPKIDKIDARSDGHCWAVATLAPTVWLVRADMLGGACSCGEVVAVACAKAASERLETVSAKNATTKYLAIPQRAPAKQVQINAIRGGRLHESAFTPCARRNFSRCCKLIALDRRQRRPASQLDRCSVATPGEEILPYIRTRIDTQNGAN